MVRKMNLTDDRKTIMLVWNVFCLLLITLNWTSTFCVASSIKSNVRGASNKSISKGEGKNDEDAKPSSPTSRPVVIYTFFSKIDNFSDGTYDNDMIEVWKSTWKEMGWEPRILTLEDAMNHPLYESYNKDLLKNVQLDPDDIMREEEKLIRNDTPIAEYNRLCYLRWLAMASVGGGWMADYDTVPVSPPKPGDESPTQFTLHNSGVPSLVSGSKDEWERLAFALLEQGKKPSFKFTSDMMSLMNLIHNDDNVNFNCAVQNEVISANNVLRSLVNVTDKNEDEKDSKRTASRQLLLMSKQDCASIKDLRAVHFSHKSIYQTRERNPNFQYKVKERPLIMKVWADVYNQSCL